MCVAKIKYRVKEHHWYKYKYTVVEESECITEPENEQNRHAVSVNRKEKKQTEQKGKKERNKRNGRTLIVVNQELLDMFLIC